LAAQALHAFVITTLISHFLIGADNIDMRAHAFDQKDGRNGDDIHAIVWYGVEIDIHLYRPACNDMKANNNSVYDLTSKATAHAAALRDAAGGRSRAAQRARKAAFSFTHSLLQPERDVTYTAVHTRVDFLVDAARRFWCAYNAADAASITPSMFSSLPRFGYTSSSASPPRRRLSILPVHTDLRMTSSDDIATLVDRVRKHRASDPEHTLHLLAGDAQLFLALHRYLDEHPEITDFVAVPGYWHWLWRIEKCTYSVCLRT
jgi:hypothetical protein